MRDYTNTTTTATDNKVNIGGLTYMLTDQECDKVKSILDGIVESRNTTASPASNILSIPEEKKAVSPAMVGKVLWQEDFCTVTETDKGMRLYITCPVKGEKGEKIRYAIKASAKKDFGATFGGDFDKKDIFWVFPNKSKAQAYIKSRKEYAKKAEKSTK